MTETTTTGPVVELRQAAALMRERAYNVARHEDRWEYHERIDGPYEGHVACEGDAQWSGMADVIVSSEAGPHIASWDPTVALAVADWLDGVAERHVFIDAPTGGGDYFTACKACYFEPIEPDEDPCPDVSAALKVARTYLRTVSAEVVTV